MNQKIFVNGLRIDNVSMEEAVALVINLAKNEGKHLVTTPNLDFLYNASNNSHFKKILNSSSLNIPDGKPLVLLSNILGKPLKEKVSGSDFFVEVCKSSVGQQLKIFILGSAPGIAATAKEKLEKKFSGLNIVGAVSPSYGFEKDDKECRELIQKINRIAPDILFVGVGSPKQELWIDKYLDQLDVKVAIGVGASFDFAAGHVKMPPPFVKKIGVAWLWRLASDPKRLWRRYLLNDLPFFIQLYFNILLNKKQKS